MRNTTRVPELPDVEHERRTFARYAARRELRGLRVPDPGIVRNTSPWSLVGSLVGGTFGEPRRHGKWLLCPRGGKTLVFHFGMTGRLVWSDRGQERHRHDRLILLLPRGELRYRTMRRLGGVWLARQDAELATLLGGLGPDALAISEERFLERLAGRRGGAKATLMDQGFVAGIGNLLADEILWQARLHPRDRVDRLSERRRRELFRTMHGVLSTSVRDFDYIERHREWLNHVRGRPEARCPRCGRLLHRSQAAGRTTYWCPRCQRPPGR